MNPSGKVFVVHATQYTIQVITKHTDVFYTGLLIMIYNNGTLFRPPPKPSQL